MDEQPGIFRTTLDLLCFILALIALMLGAMSALSGHPVWGIGWAIGATLILRGIELRSHLDDR